MPVVGVVLVLIAVAWSANTLLRLALAGIGLFLVGSRPWRLADPVLPSERRYMALRNEVDAFIGMVRRLNGATLDLLGDPSPPARARVLQIRDEMLDSVRRMERVAGRTEQEIAEDPAPPASRGV